MNPSSRATDHANLLLAKQRDDKATRWHKVRAAQATPEQAAAVFADLRAICMADECPAHAAGYETNRTFQISGRQAVWREIEQILSNQSPTPTPR